MRQDFNVIFRKDGDWWVASAVEIPGALSQGKTIEEARENLLDAVRELLLARRDIAEEKLENGQEIVREQLTIEIE